MKALAKVRATWYMRTKYGLKDQKLKESVKQLNTLMSILDEGGEICIQEANLEAAVIAAALWHCNCDMRYTYINGELKKSYIFKKP